MFKKAKVKVIVKPFHSEAFIEKFDFSDENLIEQFEEDMLQKYEGEVEILFGVCSE